MPTQHFLAFDFGAESGRAIVGTLLEREKLVLKEIHRFPTGLLSIGKHYYWNIFRFYEEVIASLEKCVNIEEIIPQSVGVDSWGVDFGLIGKNGSILRTPYAYRDPMTETSMPAFLERMGRDDIYELTGIALHKFNTLYQLYAMIMDDDPVLGIADKLLFIPDLINYLLSGEAKSEFTFATTSQLFNPQKMDWDEDIFRKLGISKDIMQEVVAPGTVIGVLNQNISRLIDVEGIKVMAVTSHDTAAAIASVPAKGDDWVYISSGTWSLMGVENMEPIIDQRSRLFNFTNEGGAEGTFRFLKNIMGLWILQECRKAWSKGQDIDYPEIIRYADMAEPFSAMIDPDYPGFYNPLDMPAAIDTFCRHTDQIFPKGIGAIARTVLEGLALKYRMVLDQLELVTAKKYKVIHIIGGGSQNELLCQFTANACGISVVTGPVEATGTGNILIQAIGLGYLQNLDHARRVVKNSFELKTYEPEDQELWKLAFERFQTIAKQI
ncbi:MAG: rhamnulokinase [Bacteroidales bacterium]|jgi:rhamnulokinase|nr:rhamnulokinase [Bacteroidales bacterium]